jgi:antitoxin (DNA-binding transcriptional repressor) of toxin-antitoxin stability system
VALDDWIEAHPTEVTDLAETWKRLVDAAIGIANVAHEQTVEYTVPRLCATMENMVTVGIRALKQNASAVVADAAAGETITITDRGRAVAQISPLPSSPLESLLAAGHGRAARRSITSLGPTQPGEPLSAVLMAMREAERY